MTQMSLKRYSASVDARREFGKSAIRNWLERLTGGLHRKRSAGTPEQADQCSTAVHDAYLSLLLGRTNEAAAILQSVAAPGSSHAGWLNLMGVICESRGDWRGARRFYGKAMRTDRDFVPAEQNMRRWYELFTFGRTQIPITLIEERANR